MVWIKSLATRDKGDMFILAVFVCRLIHIMGFFVFKIITIKVLYSNYSKNLTYKLVYPDYLVSVLKSLT